METARDSRVDANEDPDVEIDGQRENGNDVALIPVGMALQSRLETVGSRVLSNIHLEYCTARK